MSIQVSSETCRRIAAIYEKRASLQEELEQLDSEAASLQSGSENGQVVHAKRGPTTVTKAPKKVSQAKVAGDVTTFKKGGRGRKQCPECNTFVAARSEVCACGFKFKKGAKAAAKPAAKSTKKTVTKSSKSSNDQTKGQILVGILQSMPSGGKHADIVEAFLKSGYKSDASPSSLNTMVSNELSKLVKQHIVLKDNETRVFHLAKRKRA